MTLLERAAVLHQVIAALRQPRRARVFVVTPAGYVALIERHRHGLHYWAVPGGGIEPPLAMGGPEAERNFAANSYRPVWVRIDEAASLRLRPPGALSALRRL